MVQLHIECWRKQFTEGRVVTAPQPVLFTTIQTPIRQDAKTAITVTQIFTGE